MVQKRKDWASALVPRAFPSHACSRSAVTKKKNKRLLSVYSFLKTDFTVGKRPVTRAKGKTGCIHLYILTKRLSQLFRLRQELMTRSKQLAYQAYITAFSLNGLFFDTF